MRPRLRCRGRAALSSKGGVTICPLAASENPPDASWKPIGRKTNVFYENEQISRASDGRVVDLRFERVCRHSANPPEQT
jgi:hypothetical protein